MVPLGFNPSKTQLHSMSTIINAVGSTELLQAKAMGEKERQQSCTDAQKPKADFPDNIGNVPENYSNVLFSGTKTLDSSWQLQLVH